MKFLNVDSPRQSLVNVKVGENVKIFNFVNAYGCSIDDNTKVGSFVEIQKNAFIGKNCKISSHTFICEGVHIGNNCFVGHSVSFINDKYPQSANPDGSLQTESDWTVVETWIEDNVSIGTGAIILCGVRIGKGATIGAGAVVTKNVEPNSTVAGVPARLIPTRR